MMFIPYDDYASKRYASCAVESKRTRKPKVRTRGNRGVCEQNVLALSSLVDYTRGQKEEYREVTSITSAIFVNYFRPVFTCDL
jgi:hypothetical protein